MFEDGVSAGLKAVGLLKSDARMNQHGIKDPKDFSRQKGQVERLKELVPQFGERAQSLKQNTDFLDAIVKGIEQATRAMEAQRQREKNIGLRQEVSENISKTN